MRKKLIFLFLIMISAIKADPTISTRESWKAGEDYSVIIDAPEDHEVYLQITDSSGLIQLPRTKPDKIQPGTYSYIYSVPSNEENCDYIIKAWSIKGAQLGTATKTVKIKSMPFWLRFIRIVFPKLHF